MSAFYIVAYLSLSVPAVLAGLIVTRLGLTQTFRLFGLIVIGLALIVGVATPRRQSPRNLDPTTMTFPFDDPNTRHTERPQSPAHETVDIPTSDLPSSDTVIPPTECPNRGGASCPASQ